jgi:hypothetical protein
MSMKELLHLPRDWMRKVRRTGRQHFFPVLVTRDGNLKLPPALFLDSLCRASRGGRLKLFRRLMPYLFAPPAASSTEVCEINSLAEFESGYARLAVMLGHAGKTPPPGEIEFLQSILSRPMQYPGTIAASDYFFLTAFVSILAPQRRGRNRDADRILGGHHCGRTPSPGARGQREMGRYNRPRAEMLHRPDAPDGVRNRGSIP